MKVQKMVKKYSSYEFISREELNFRAQYNYKLIEGF